jgi:hypothetical protein
VHTRARSAKITGANRPLPGALPAPPGGSRRPRGAPAEINRRTAGASRTRGRPRPSPRRWTPRGSGRTPSRRASRVWVGGGSAGWAKARLQRTPTLYGRSGPPTASGTVRRGRGRGRGILFWDVSHTMCGHDAAAHQDTGVGRSRTSVGPPESQRHNGFLGHDQATRRCAVPGSAFGMDGGAQAASGGPASTSGGPNGPFGTFAGNITRLLAQREAGMLRGRNGGQSARRSERALGGWAELDFLAHSSSAQYSELRPMPRSTIAAAFSPDGATVASTQWVAHGRCGATGGLRGGGHGRAWAAGEARAPPWAARTALLAMLNPH